MSSTHRIALGAALAMALTGIALPQEGGIKAYPTVDRVEYVLDGPTLLGTGGAIERALPKLPDAFFVLYGDSYLECNFRAVQAAFRAARVLPLPLCGLLPFWT